MRRTVNSHDKPFELDNVDRKIISALIEDSRRPYIDIAHELNVSGGTIHVRMDKLKKAGVVKGSRMTIDYQRLGYGVQAFVGINLHNAKDYKKVVEKITEFNEIVEAHYSTGDYNIFTKVIVHSVADLHQFLLDLQGIREIQSTATIMILDTPITRDLKP
jgi:Lrp/AsnC family transcriptional regulator for asnA, asnC and gidA